MAAEQKLKQMNYKPIHDGFVDIIFADPKSGLHGACPAKLLHAFQLGLCERTLQSLFGMKQRRKSGKRKADPTNSIPRAKLPAKKSRANPRVDEEGDNGNTEEDGEDHLSDSDEEEDPEVLVGEKFASDSDNSDDSDEEEPQGEAKETHQPGWGRPGPGRGDCRGIQQECF